MSALPADARVVVIGDTRAERLLGPIVTALAERGCTVARHESATAALADDRRETTPVILAMGEIACDRTLLDAYPNVRMVASTVIGYERIDVPAATQRGVAVANAYSPQTVESMAEATILLVLAALYDLRRSEALLREDRAEPPFARMLGGRTVGIIGFGAIGRAIAERLQGWGAQVLATTRRPLANAPSYVRAVDIDTAIAQSDVVILAASLNSESRHLLNRERLKALRPGAVLVNTARGGLIDEAALIEVLRERPDVRIALDTFEVTPLPADSPLRAIEGAILTPHRVGHTRDAITGLQQMSVDNAMAALRGELPPGLRNAEIAEAWRSRWSA